LAERGKIRINNGRPGRPLRSILLAQPNNLADRRDVEARGLGLEMP
jgi:hypothetical protein